MIGTKGKINGQKKEYKPNRYNDQRKLVKVFFDSIPAVARNNMSTQSKSTIDNAYTPFTPTPQISELPIKESYITAYKGMVSRMQEGESPTQEDLKIIAKLSIRKLDPNIYSYADEQLRLELLDWGGITPQIETLWVKESYTTRFKKMQTRMENGEMPTIDDMEILWKLSQRDSIPQFYDEEAEKLRRNLLSWGGFSDNSNTQSDTYTKDDYEKIYRLTDINQIDRMIKMLQLQRERLEGKEYF